MGITRMHRTTTHALIPFCGCSSYMVLRAFLWQVIPHRGLLGFWCHWCNKTKEWLGKEWFSLLIPFWKSSVTWGLCMSKQEQGKWGSCNSRSVCRSQVPPVSVPRWSGKLLAVTGSWPHWHKGCQQWTGDLMWLRGGWAQPWLFSFSHNPWPICCTTTGITKSCCHPLPWVHLWIWQFLGSPRWWNVWPGVGGASGDVGGQFTLLGVLAMTYSDGGVILGCRGALSCELK